MIFSTLKTRFADFMLTTDTAELPIVTADRDRALNEAYFWYLARFLNSFKYTADFGPASQTIVGAMTFGLAADNQIIECEGMDLKTGANASIQIPEWMPLKRQTIGQVQSLVRSEGAVGTPEIYGIALRSRTLSTGASLFFANVYPIPDQTYSYRAKIRSWPAELSLDADVLQCDETQGDDIARVAALWSGTTLGYGDNWERALMLGMDDRLRREIEVDNYARFTKSQPRRIAELVGGL